MTESDTATVATPYSSTQLDEESQVTVIQQVFDLWLTPEMEQRILDGRWVKGQPLTAAQVLLPSPLDGNAPLVRLNEEVQVIAKVQFKEGVNVTPRQPVTVGQIEEISSVERVPSDDPNSGMITLVSLGDRWHLYFDLRRDVQRAERLLNTAEEFALAARDSFAASRTGPAFDNLFSAAELAARAHLLVHVFYPYNNPKDHGAINARHKRWVSLMNLPRAHNDALSKLKHARAAARYLEVIQPLPDFGPLLWAVAHMIVLGRREIRAQTEILLPGEVN